MKAPVLPGLYDVPTRVDVNRWRDASMEQVEQHAAETRAKFADDASAFVLSYLQRHGPTSGEALSVQCKMAGIVPHDDRAFGPVYMRLAKAGAIEKVGATRRERGHGTAGGNIWSARLQNC